MFSCNCPNCLSENVRFDLSTIQSQTVVEKYFYVETVGSPSQKQKIHSWKVSEHLSVPSGMS